MTKYLTKRIGFALNNVVSFGPTLSVFASLCQQISRINRNPSVYVSFTYASNFLNKIRTTPLDSYKNLEIASFFSLQPKMLDFPVES